MNVSNGGLLNPKLALKVNSLWIKIKAQNYSGQVLNKHTFKSEGKEEVIFLITVTRE